MSVAFYLPRHFMPNEAKREVWRSGGHITREQMGKGGCAENWIYQTWNALQLAGVPAGLVDRMPETGVVVCLSATLQPGFRAPRGCYVVAVAADGLPHPGAHVHVLQNSHHAKFLPSSIFMPHWPQPNLVPRTEEREGKLEKVCFFGDPANLAPELRDAVWQERLHERTGAKFVIRWHTQWHDYSDIDAVVAVRDFTAARHIHKPATKLYNAWLAGVPFVGGNDSAYRSDGRVGVDYLAARSPGETIAQLLRLRDEPRLRAKLVAAGRDSARSYTHEAVLRRWTRLVTAELPQRAEGWRRSPAPFKAGRMAVNRTACHLDRVLRRRYVRPTGDACGAEGRR
jgi:hypothetical protein